MHQASGEGGALLRAICNNPDEDTPRLVYADWLDEQGGESNAARAEFIRLQIAEAAKARQKHVTSVGALRFPTPRESQLLRQGAGWDDGLPKIQNVRYGGGMDLDRFERGFPWQVSVPDVERFIKIAPKLFTTAPITYLHLGNLKITTARMLAASPHMERIRQWQDVYSRRTDKMLAEIGKSPYLKNLREIDLTGAPITSAGIKSLLCAPGLRGMIRLTFASCTVGDAGAEEIAGSPACAALEHLNLTYQPLTVVAARALATAPLRQTMRSLLLSNTRLDDDAAIVLATREWSRLQYLILDNNQVTDRGAAAFLDSAFWRSSESDVWLSGNSISDAMKDKLKVAFGSRVRV